MAIYYGLGSTIVSKEQYAESITPGTLGRLREMVAEKAGADAFLEVAGQQVQVASILQPTALGGIPFTPIEFGKPLSVEIRWVYTGKYPETSWFQSKKDMLIASAFKSIATFNEAPRAVNIVRQAVRPNSNIQWGATDKGTRLAFYTPAVSENATLATFELIFDNFPDDIVSKLGSAFTAAAGIPIFAAQSSYFLAAGTVTKLLAKAGHTLFDGDVAFRVTEEIDFMHPGDEPSMAGWRVLTPGGPNNAFAESVTVGPKGQLLDRSGSPYSGDTPYMVISLDGAAVDEFRSFTPTAASAALLEKFFGVQDGQTQPLDLAIEALKLYSDYNFRTKAESLKKDLDRLSPNDPRFAEKQKQLEALKANIQTDELKM